MGVDLFHVTKLSVPELPSAQSVNGLNQNELVFTRPGMLSGTVIVQDGLVVGVTNAFDGQIGLPNPDMSQFKSVEKLFEVIRQAQLQQADTIAIKYDAVLGFPADIRLDFLAGAVDDEIEYEASDVQSIK